MAQLQTQVTPYPNSRCILVVNHFVFSLVYGKNGCCFFFVFFLLLFPNEICVVTLSPPSQGIPGLPFFLFAVSAGSQNILICGL